MPHYVRVACLCRLTLLPDKGLGLWGVDCGEYERVYMVAENGFPSALKEAHGCVLNGLQYIFQNAGYKKPEKGIWKIYGGDRGAVRPEQNGDRRASVSI